MKRLPLLVLSLLSLFLLHVLPVRADEGMWMLGNLDKKTRKEMKALGLRMPADKLYSEKKPSLKDAIVSFGGFCSGVVVSEEGLVFTNHHCGFSCIQQHSTVEHDYLKNGFVAANYEDELLNPELYVRFLLRQENVTQRVLAPVLPDMDEAQRSSVVDSMMYLIESEVVQSDTTVVAIVDAFYGGNEFWLSVYQDYNDVRLVYAPPSSVGKFGWDTDNWEWPRHTGDFSVFRIYADRENRPADYSPDNVPYRPKYVAPISLNGYQEGSFCMTLGYPGSTERYLSSFGIEEMMHNQNQAQIDVRGVKQAIWKREMDARDSIRIKYASKYDESSNYWKNSIGVNRAIGKLKVLDKKRSLEKLLLQWIREQSPQELQLLNELRLAYGDRREVNRAQAYFMESFFYGPELVQVALTILNMDWEGEEKHLVASLKRLMEQYDDLDSEIDREVFAALLEEYRRQVPARYLPDMYDTIDKLYGGNTQAYAADLYARTNLITTRGLECILANDSTYQFYQDPAIDVCIDLLAKFFEMNAEVEQPSQLVEAGERRLNAAVRRMYAQRNFYPDANFTMRLSFGTVCGYEPFDGVAYDYRTTADGILQKVKAHAGDVDFAVQPEILSMLSSRNFGRYADKLGEMPVCFISNNDITGGNSGSAMFNDRGELLGLAFDGNWEAMSSDILYEPHVQRCICVDVRYVLFMMEHYGHADRLIQELKIK